jgi:hypothetical protein
VSGRTDCRTRSMFSRDRCGAKTAPLACKRKRAQEQSAPTDRSAEVDL